MGAPLIERLAESGVQHHCRGGGGRGAQPGGVTGPGGALTYEAAPLGSGALPRAAWLASEDGERYSLSFLHHVGSVGLCHSLTP